MGAHSGGNLIGDGGGEKKLTQPSRWKNEARPYAGHPAQPRKVSTQTQKEQKGEGGERPISLGQRKNRRGSLRLKKN